MDDEVCPKKPIVVWKGKQETRAHVYWPVKISEWRQHQDDKNIEWAEVFYERCVRCRRTRKGVGTIARVKENAR